MIRTLRSMVLGCWWLTALTALAVAVLALAGPARAQAPELRPGDRVRLQVGRTGPRHTGRLVALGRDSLVLQLEGEPGPIVEVPRAIVSRTWVSAGRARSTVKGMGIGAMAGLVPGALLGAVAGQICLDAFSCHDTQVRGGAMLAGAGAGAAAGLVLGAMVGSVRTHERWRPVALPSVAAAPGGGRLGLALRLPL